MSAKMMPDERCERARYAPDDEREHVTAMMPRHELIRLRERASLMMLMMMRDDYERRQMPRRHERHTPR